MLFLYVIQTCSTLFPPLASFFTFTLIILCGHNSGFWEETQKETLQNVLHQSVSLGVFTQFFHEKHEKRSGDAQLRFSTLPWPIRNDHILWNFLKLLKYETKIEFKPGKVRQFYYKACTRKNENEMSYLEKVNPVIYSTKRARLVDKKVNLSLNLSLIWFPDKIFKIFETMKLRRLTKIRFKMSTICN